MNETLNLAKVQGRARTKLAEKGMGGLSSSKAFREQARSKESLRSNSSIHDKQGKP